MANLTKDETNRLLRAVQQLARRAVDALDHDEAEAIWRIETLTNLADGVRYDLIDERGDTIRKASVIETVDSMLTYDGWITVGNVRCYVVCDNDD